MAKGDKVPARRGEPAAEETPFTEAIDGEAQAPEQVQGTQQDAGQGAVSRQEDGALTAERAEYPDGSPNIPDGVPMRMLAHDALLDAAKPDGERVRFYNYVSAVGASAAREMTEVVGMRVDGAFVPVE